MADFLVDFEWYKNANGFKLIPWKSIISAGRPLDRSGDCIVANGRKWIPYRPLDEFDTLYIVFADVKTPNDLLKFMNMFGPLTPILFGIRDSDPEPVHAVPVWGDDVSFGLNQARLFRELLLRQRRPTALADFFRSQIRAAEIRSHKEAYKRAEAAAPEPIEVDPTWSSIPAAFDLTVGPQKGIQIKLKRPRQKSDYDELLWLNLPIAEIDLIPDSQKGVRLRLKTESLIGALWWQLAQKLSGNSMVRQCRHWGTLFEVGLGTKRRGDATFCSDEHSVRFHSLRRSKKSGGG
jgi:hypothetical protein